MKLFREGVGLLNAIQALSPFFRSRALSSAHRSPAVGQACLPICCTSECSLPMGLRSLSLMLRQDISLPLSLRDLDSGSRIAIAFARLFLFSSAPAGGPMRRPWTTDGWQGLWSSTLSEVWTASRPSARARWSMTLEVGTTMPPHSLSYRRGVAGRPFKAPRRSPCADGCCPRFRSLCFP
jgi:hypothetical protein